LARKEYAITPNAISAIAYFVVLWITIWYQGTGLLAPTPLFWPILIGLIIGAGINMFDFERKEDNFDGPWLINGSLAIIWILIAIGISFFNSDMFRARSKADLIGKVEVANNLNSAFQPADPAHICLVSIDMAKIKAQDALSKLKMEGDIIAGSRFDIGEGTKQFADSALWWVFPLEFQGYFKWKKGPEIPGYLRVSAEDPKAEPQAVQYDKLGEKIIIKYSTSACYDYEAKRYLRHNGFAGAILEDWTMEVNDDWRPYYTVSVMKRTLGYGGEIFLGIIAFDMQTGKIDFVLKDQLESAQWSWIDRGIPLDNLDYQLSKWGDYAKSNFWYNLFHNDKSQESTPGWYMTYEGNKCRWFTGWTSKNTDDQALTGFSVSDGKTGKTIFYKATGVTEDIAKETAISLWKNFDGYETTELVPYNIYGVITYVCPITYNGQFKGVSLVSMSNKDINARGNTLSEVLANYRAALMNTGGRYAPNGESSKIMTLDGTVSAIGQALQLGQSQLFTFMLKGINKSFTCAYTDKTLEVPYLTVGQKVSVSYLNTEEAVIQVEKLDIEAISFTDKNPEQAKLLENQAVTDKESDRISRQEKVDRIIESPDMKNVDPQKLKEFLQQQQSKEKK